MNRLDPRNFVLVWDLPVRVFHWLLVISFAGAWLTAEGESLKMLHYAFGYSACALVFFRLIWGFIGTRYARFAQFLHGPRQILLHFRSLLTSQQHTSPGHNPAGGMVMVTLMAIIMAIGLTGYLQVSAVLGQSIGHFMGEVHESIASLCLALVLLHVSVAIIMSFSQQENLIRAMVTGKKLGTPDQAIQYSMHIVGIGLALAWGYTFYLIYSGATPGLT